MLQPSCPHAAFCIHPCDWDECMLETIEQPNGPEVPLTQKQCEQFIIYEEEALRKFNML